MKHEKFLKKYLRKIKSYFIENWQIYIIIALFFIIKLFFITFSYHLPIWDEAVYIGMGKYIYSLGTSGIWEIIRPIGLPLITGIFWKIHLGQFFYELVMILFSCATILIVYNIGKEFINKKVGILAAAIIAFTPIFFLYSGYMLTEIPSTFFVVLATYLFARHKYLLAGITSGLAFMFKFPQGLILLVLALALGYIAITNILQEFMSKNKYKSARHHNNNRKAIIISELKILIMAGLKILAGFMIILTPFIVFNYIQYSAYTGTATDALFRPMILAAPHQQNAYNSVLNSTWQSKAYNMLYYIIVMIKDYSMLILLLPALIFMFIKKEYLDKKKVIIIIACLVYFAYWTSILNKQERFSILILPFVALICAYSIWKMYEYLINTKSKNKSKFLKIIIVIVLILCTVSMIIAVKKDISYFSWRQSLNNKPEIITGLYDQVNQLQLNGTILTTDPVFTAFTDKKVSPFYFTLEGKVIYSNEWEQKDVIGGITYSEISNPCPVDDANCLITRRKIFSNLLTDYKIVYNKTYYDTSQYILVPK